MFYICYKCTIGVIVHNAGIRVASDCLFICRSLNLNLKIRDMTAPPTTLSSSSHEEFLSQKTFVATDSEAIHSYNLSSIDNDLPQIIVKQMNRIPFGMEKENIYYNYYSSNQIKQVLNSVLYELDINVRIDTISMIASYCNILKWDRNQKGKKIDCNIVSKDESINYAVLKEATTKIINNPSFETVLLNEWIGDLDEEPNKYIFRYVFKYFGTPINYTDAHILVGMIGKQFSGGFEHFSLGFFPQSMSLHCFGKSQFYCSNSRIRSFNIPLGKGSIDNMYFVMEINLKSRFLAFYGPAMYVLFFNSFGIGLRIFALCVFFLRQQIKNLKAKIPDELTLPLKVGVSFLTTKVELSGIGLVTMQQFKQSKLTLTDISGLRTLLPFEIDKRCKIVPDYLKKQNIGFNYYSLDEFIAVLLECNLLADLTSQEELESALEVICDYCGLAEWSSQNIKETKIVIRESQDSKISYAILSEATNDGFGTIFLNNTFGIDNDKQLYRYIFKWFGIEPEFNKNEVSIGIVSCKHNDCSVKNGETSDKIGDFNDSIGWYYVGNDENNGFSRFVCSGNTIEDICDNNKIDFALGGVKRELVTSEFEPNMYFMIEIDLKMNFVSFIGRPFEKKTAKKFGFSIENIAQPFELAISLKSIHKNSIGIGIVKTKITNNILNKNALQNEFSSFLAVATPARPDLDVSLPRPIATKLKQTISIASKKSSVNIYGYNYYSLQQLKQVLDDTDLILKFEINSNIINTIITYCGITNWDIINKSRNINIYKSNDDSISYAILNRGNIVFDAFGAEESYSWDSILMNEWIGVSDDKLIFRYLFKWFGGKPQVNLNPRKLGIVAEASQQRLDQTVSSVGSCVHSISWDYDTKSVFNFDGWAHFRRHIANSATIGFDRDETSINNYFLMEVNLKGNYIKFEGSGINSDQFGVSIAHLKKPFKIGISFLNTIDMNAGLGIVSLSEKNFSNISSNFDDAKDNIYDFGFIPVEVAPLRTDNIPTGIRTKLPNIIMERLKQVRNGMNANSIGYHYYCVRELKDALLECKLISEVSNDKILQTICEFIGLTKWDANNKDKNIDIEHSNDGKIEYAILKHHNSGSCDTILLNEWIGLSEDKLIYRYVFKWYMFCFS